MLTSGGDTADMRTIKIIHSADLHLDSPFEGLSAAKAAVRRAEQRLLLQALADLTAQENADLVLLSGDLLDSSTTFQETGEELIRSLGCIPAPVFIAPGNHDFYSSRSPYARLKLPDNVHIFTENAITYLSVPSADARVYGAAFLDRFSLPLLRGFHAERKPGVYNILCLHGEYCNPASSYDPISDEDLAASGMDYAALGHIHEASGLRKTGATWFSWPGCPEGRGFDETGEKTVNIIELTGDSCVLRTASIASRCYRTLSLDVSSVDPLLAIHTTLPDDTVRDIYRITLTGDTVEPPDLRKLYQNLEEMFFSLQLRDETRLRKSVWDAAGEDTLRGIFLAKLRSRYEAAMDEEQRTQIEQAARWGLAALDNAEEVMIHEDP